MKTVMIVMATMPLSWLLLVLVVVATVVPQSNEHPQDMLIWAAPPIAGPSS